MTTSNALALLLLISALVAATGFVGMYAVFAPWRSNEVGRSMMLLAVSLIMLIISGILLNLFGTDYPFRDAVRITTYVVLNVALWRQVLLLARILNGKSRGSEEPTEPEPKAPLRAVPNPRESDEAEDKLSAV